MPIKTQRFYLRRELTNLYSIIQGSLELSLSELVFFDASLWNQSKFIAFYFFSCRNLIISCKILIATVKSNETTNKLAIYAILVRNVTIFYLQELVSLFQVRRRLRTGRNLK